MLRINQHHLGAPSMRPLYRGMGGKAPISPDSRFVIYHCQRQQLSEKGASMAGLFCSLAIILLVITAVLQFTSKRVIGCWLLMLFPIALCIGILFDLARGVRESIR